MGKNNKKRMANDQFDELFNDMEIEETKIASGVGLAIP